MEGGREGRHCRESLTWSGGERLDGVGWSLGMEWDIAAPRVGWGGVLLDGVERSGSVGNGGSEELLAALGTDDKHVNGGQGRGARCPNVCQHH